jgi:hypothetical protein
MPLSYRTDWIPISRADCLSLLRSVEDKVGRLTWEQRQAIRRLYFLDDGDRSVAEKVETGEVQP